MKRKPDEVIEIIKEQIDSYVGETTPKEFGEVLSVGDGIAKVHGLPNVGYSEMIIFEGEVDVYGIVQGLEKDVVGISILGESSLVYEGMKVSRSGNIMQIPVSDEMIGRVIDPLGRPLDGKGDITTDTYREVEQEPAGVMDRQPVTTPLQTGIKAIDTLVPIGRGQRELIIGDRQTGKTTLAIDTIINQKDQDIVCIYVAIGQKESTVSSVVQTLLEHNALEYTTVITSSASQPTALQYLAPYSGITLAEYFMYQGKDVLVVYDDLSKHAVAYREISLLLKRPPGREAYPGDVFYLHSRLLERSARLSKELGGGSITSLPFIETQASNEAAYIPTNVISITDGQIFLKTELFNSGVRPAIDAGLSVSRVGGSAQIKAMKQVSGSLRINLASYRELESFSQFASDLDETTKSKLDRGKRTVETLKQSINSPVSVEKQVCLFYALDNGYLDKVEVDNILRYEQELYKFLDEEAKELCDQILEKKVIDDEIKDSLEEKINHFSNEVFKN